MKVIRKEFVVENNQIDHIMSERQVLANIDSPFIVKMHYAFQTEDKLYFVTDYVPGGELYTYFK
jgi:serine/threonine protein kinase